MTVSLAGPTVLQGVSTLTEQDLYLFNEGSHFRLHDKLGAKPMTVAGTAGTYFAVWAPSAQHVGVMGEFNGWNKTSHGLSSRGQSGIWEGFVPGVGTGSVYKYHVISHSDGYQVDKADPLAVRCQLPPETGSVVWELDYRWGDAEWMANRAQKNSLAAPMSIYEVHIGSWRRVPEDSNRPLTYCELAQQMAEYVTEAGFTHVEFMPVMEHPFYGSWGYQVTGFFAPTSRYGTPQDFMYLIDYLHQHGIGVILDWVPSHFPTDEHGLIFFDGTHLYEHADPKKGIHRDWNTAVFNYNRHEVRSFLTSSAMFWLEKYHVDGLRMDAIASMLYLDYSRGEGDWVPNYYGGRENIEAVWFLRRLNEEVFRVYPDVQTFAEESTSWPMVSRPTNLGGLGFGMKWDMGWMHDTLHYMALDPVYRRFHHQRLTFRGLYAFTENFTLPLSHDEVVHGKGSLVQKMSGDDWQKFANLRLLLGYMVSLPGKKLTFMGCEFAQWAEWNHDTSLDWHLLQYAPHAGMRKWVTDLNALYRSELALHELDCQPAGFEWIDANDSDASALSYLRRGRTVGSEIVVVCNFTPVPRYNYTVGVPQGGFWHELLNSDSAVYGGGGVGNLGGIMASSETWHGRAASLSLTLPPLGIVFCKRVGGPEDATAHP